MIVRGTITVPGDKSITHRALLFAALSRGSCLISGALTSLDARSTAAVLRRLGVGVGALRRGARVRVVAPEALSAPDGPLDCGNSGTTARLGLGVLAGHPFRSTLTGDRSLRRRPMRRVTEPLVLMGAGVEPSERDGLPVTITGGRLRPLRWELPVSSAQLKGALLLAGVVGRVPVRVREPAGRSRDHTERLLRWFGYGVTESDDGWIGLEPDGEVVPFSMAVPGDISSAAFLVAAGTLADEGDLRLPGVGVNPTRTGFLDVLRRMGGQVDLENPRIAQGEPVADLVVRPAPLQATQVSGPEIPGLIDEVPVLAVLASRAQGTTVFHEVGELRVKESDRLRLLAENLRAVGVEADAADSTLWVTGDDRPPRGRIVTEGDHRIAMAFEVLGRVRGAAVAVDDLGCAEVSFPGFPAALRAVTGAGR